MCPDEDWNTGTWVAVIFAALVALGGVEGAVDVFAILAGLANGASACIDKICIAI
jgi:hypothetical protein